MKVDTMRGADPNALEEKIKQWKGGDEDSQDDDVIVKGHVRLWDKGGISKCQRTCKIMR